MCLLPGLKFVFIIFYQYFVVYTSFDIEHSFRSDVWLAKYLSRSQLIQLVL